MNGQRRCNTHTHTHTHTHTYSGILFRCKKEWSNVIWCLILSPLPRSSSCTGAGEPREAAPWSRSGGAAARRYPSFKVRRGGCALLEQPWRDAPSLRWEKPKLDGRCCERASEGRHTKTIITETSQSAHRTAAMSNSVTLHHAMWGHPKWSGHGGEVR